MNSALNTLTKLVTTLFFSVIFFAIFTTPASAIVGGEEASIYNQPWMVAVALADESNGYYAQFCGGTLIAEQWVLTAAHCTLDENNRPFNVDDIDIIVGRTKLDSRLGERIAIKRIIRHAGFDLLTYNNDIALLQLSAPVTVAPVALLSAKGATAEQKSGDATVLGWGVTDDGNGASRLQKATLPLTSRETCQDAYDDYGVQLTGGMMCAGFALGGSDSCVGDSGGPLVSISDDGEATQIGLVSWGLECGAAGIYGVYTDVSQYGRWLAFQMSFYR